MDPSADPRWIPEAEYESICARVPIVCVDLLALVAGTQNFVLIERDTPDGGRGLNLVGGAVLLDEPLHEALDRHVTSTLGEDARLEIPSLQLVGVYQYFKQRRPGALHDPRKNAVALTYTGRVSGPFRAIGEAHEVHEFGVDDAPGPEAFGWEQGPVVYEALDRARAGSRV